MSVEVVDLSTQPEVCSALIWVTNTEGIPAGLKAWLTDIVAKRTTVSALDFSERMLELCSYAPLFHVTWKSGLPGRTPDATYRM